MARRSISLRLVPILIAVVVVGFQYCSSEKVRNPLTGETTRVGLSRKQEDQLGLQAFQQVTSSEKTVTSGPQWEQVNRVATRLAKATGPEAEGFEWMLSLVENPQENAFCLPGGKIVVYTGILSITETDAGLAAVMGHEMAHATLRHGGQRVLKENMTNTLLAGASVSLADMDYQQQRAIMGLIGAGARFGVILPFGREHESEADEMGVFYMARAGYDPREAIEFWKRMSKNKEGQQPPEFMSTHPSHGSRIERLKQIMPRALEEYEKARLKLPGNEALERN